MPLIPSRQRSTTRVVVSLRRLVTSLVIGLWTVRNRPSTGGSCARTAEDINHKQHATSRASNPRPGRSSPEAWAESRVAGVILHLLQGRTSHFTIWRPFIDCQDLSACLF